MSDQPKEMDQAGLNPFIAKALEITKHTCIIVEDMKKNRSEYSTLDLTWRCVELMEVITKCFEDLVRNIAQAYPSGSPVSAELVESQAEGKVSMDRMQQAVDEAVKALWDEGIDELIKKALADELEKRKQERKKRKGRETSEEEKDEAQPDKEG